MTSEIAVMNQRAVALAADSAITLIGGGSVVVRNDQRKLFNLVDGRAVGLMFFGVADLSGNVEEWTADWYVESLGPGLAPRAGSAHVMRGGGWQSPPSMSRTTARDWGSVLDDVRRRSGVSDRGAPARP